jgi:hypothetical protein
VEDDDLPKSSARGWTPQIHFVWDIILDQLLSEPSPSKGSFQEFFRVVVDGKALLRLPPWFANYFGHRITVFFDCVFGTQILGFPSFPKGTTTCERHQFANVIHKKLHAHLD